MKKFYALFFSSLFCLPGFSQLLIDPSGVGGFEAGGSFPANGWVAVPSATSSNTWVVGTSTKNSGSNSAYISNGGGAYAFDNTSAGVSHFYKDIAIPSGATNITLSFYLKGNKGTNSDLLRIYTADPAAGDP